MVLNTTNPNTKIVSLYDRVSVQDYQIGREMDI